MGDLVGLERPVEPEAVHAEIRIARAIAKAVTNRN
jgi:hypothetical protein